MGGIVMMNFLKDPLVIASIGLGAFTFALVWKRKHKHIHDMEEVAGKAFLWSLGVTVGTYFGLLIAKIVFDSLLL